MQYLQLLRSLLTCYICRQISMFLFLVLMYLLSYSTQVQIIVWPSNTIVLHSVFHYFVTFTIQQVFQVSFPFLTFKFRCYPFHDLLSDLFGFILFPFLQRTVTLFLALKQHWNFVFIFLPMLVDNYFSCILFFSSSAINVFSFEKLFGSIFILQILKTTGCHKKVLFSLRGTKVIYIQNYFVLTLITRNFNIFWSISNHSIEQKQD